MGRVLRVAGMLALVAVILVFWLNAGIFRGSSPEPGEIVPDPKVVVSPEKQYSLVYWEYRLPVFFSDGSDYEAYVREMIEAFQTIYPNVAIEYRLLDPANAPEELARALAVGEPPDVYGGIAEPARLDRDWQIPVQPYLSESEPQAFHPLAGQAVTEDGQMMAWPRWLRVAAWLGNRSILNKVGVNLPTTVASGWTWEDFAGYAAKMTAALGKGNYGLMINNANPDYLEQLLLNSYAAQNYSAEGGSVWSEEALAETLDWLETLAIQGNLPAEGGKMHSLVLPQYWGGRVMAVAGLGPWLVDKEAERLQRQERNLIPGSRIVDSVATVLLPIPHAPGARPAAPATAGTITVFRQQVYQGHDHTRAAMEFARFISRDHSSWLAGQIGYLPAWQDDLIPWLADPDLDPLSRVFYTQALQSGVPSQRGLSASGRAQLRGPGMLLLEDFWSRKTGGRDTAAKLWQALGPEA